MQARALILRGASLTALDRPDEADAALAEAIRIADTISYPNAAWRALGLRAREVVGEPLVDPERLLRPVQVRERLEEAVGVLVSNHHPDPGNPTPDTTFSGFAQDIAVYTTFIRLK